MVSHKLSNGDSVLVNVCTFCGKFYKHVDDQLNDFASGSSDVSLIESIDYIHDISASLNFQMMTGASSGETGILAWNGNLFHIWNKMPQSHEFSGSAE